MLPFVLWWQYIKVIMSNRFINSHHSVYRLPMVEYYQAFVHLLFKGNQKDISLLLDEVWWCAGSMSAESIHASWRACATVHYPPVLRCAVYAASRPRRTWRSHYRHQHRLLNEPSSPCCEAFIANYMTSVL